VVFQAQGYSINEQADLFLSGLIRTGNASLSPGFFVLGSQLRFCDHVPKSFSTDSCQVVWDGADGGTGNGTSISAPGNSTAQAPTGELGARSRNDKRALPQPHNDTHTAKAHRTPLNGQIGVTLKGFELNGEDVTLDESCLVVLNWPVQT
jgi:hypothetical protein